MTEAEHMVALSRGLKALKEDQAIAIERRLNILNALRRQTEDHYNELIAEELLRQYQERGDAR